MQNAKNKKHWKRSRVFEGQRHAAATLGISLDDIKAAKRAGCTAFRSGNRIDEGELLDWLKRNKSRLAKMRESFGEKKIREQIRKLQIDNERKQSRLIEKSLIQTRLRELASGQSAILRQKLENEYPSAVAGLDVPQARVYGKRLCDTICEMMQQLVKDWNDD